MRPRHFRPLERRCTSAQSTPGEVLAMDRQAPYKKEIFGEKSSRELFSPRNTLLLSQRVEEALDKGYIAIVPDVELDLAEPECPHNDQDERRAHLREREQHRVREFKVIVLDRERNIVDYGEESESDKFNESDESDGGNEENEEEATPNSREHQAKEGSINASSNYLHQVAKVPSVAYLVRMWTHMERCQGKYGRDVQRNHLFGFVE
ncbi:uncharacterized protein B0J16DRAFT_315103 [Fusarium flagelliforme]|uniref:uncharacterized protein n=1 Tax=Fusarium flagelliforme TaxID=2675880 RepID=UPI001E8D3681|nr:uncharacterized protein B0J16DRAFT_315103 [Fusarium flagelliforme]KAH7198807.1 hypothetical protein B0J16DRAFT_315103 [Fusarium flagelliforme]